MMRVGLGIDVHPFDVARSERTLVLGGVCIDGARALRGHSDADVVAHACADALLGAAGLGDIGDHFPDSDERWRSADSLTLLTQVVAMVEQEGWSPVNVDCSIVCEAPNLARYRAEMCERLSAAIGADVSVKATRPEQLGALGREEGIACLAVALVDRP